MGRFGKIRQLAGYCYAVKNYLRTPKGCHDAVDYARAAVIMASVSAIVGLVINLVYQNL
ncbi:hypothetical protein [Sporomusa malonica]|uniref:hypothetical protein n=1 Tax=Sporomusa malonica TaxID=112901 RepID=UPI0015936B3B|nr:hypothetical protein [Sporomusa malonica]